MVLEHQAHITNLLSVLANQVNGGASVSDLNRTVQEVVDYMLFVDEAQLPARFIGTSGFTEYFSSLGPRDSRGRSLRDFDLNRRLFRYPCSYMIYSKTFEGLPRAAKDAVYAMLFDRLTSQARHDVLEILTETEPGFAAKRKRLLARSLKDQLITRTRNTGE